MTNPEDPQPVASEQTSDNVESKEPAAPTPVSPPAPSPETEDTMAVKTEPSPAPEVADEATPAPNAPKLVAPEDEIQADQEAKASSPEKAEEGDIEEQPVEKKEEKKKKREINPKFKDVRETGKWGDISKSEILVVSGVIGLIVVLAIILIPILVVRSNQEDPVRGPPPPTMPPTAMTAEMELSAIRSAVEGNEFTSGLVASLPDSTDAYEGLYTDVSASPQERAMSWMLFEDGYNDPEHLVVRWSLASFYYSLGGGSWNNSTNWLGDGHYCSWYGVLCDRFERMEQLVLEANNLVGTIPAEVALWDNLQVFWLNFNELSGTIPGEVLGSLPKMSIIYLDNNKLSGTVPESLRNNEVLRKYHCMSK